jgi:hypothetical protein
MPVNRRVVGPSGDAALPWKVTGGSVTTYHHTQEDGESAARGDLRQSGGGELTIQGRDGRIRDSDTVAPGHDPNPPRDRR